MSTCIFCKIISGQSPETVIEYEDDKVIIINDIHPASKNHFLAIPKVHYENAKILRKEHEPLVMHMENMLNQLLKTRNLECKDTLFGFHWPPFISVKHLHMHAIVPQSEMGFFSRLIFNPRLYWFVTPCDLLQSLK